ncbi:pilin [Stenotrophomonas maltophilia]|uniref:pilin n=1 Tax=Stenotrophomonas maltophilia TaxID=40324 RepID=UPI000C26A9D5|nr:pilin [Stenotrophomonas maltophilia]PJL59441.1 hypothetical protein B9Y82_12175 [Stenotrophomonas maltophilia]
MRSRSTTQSTRRPRHYRPWASVSIVAGLTATYALLLCAPRLDSDASHTRLRDAASVLGGAIAAVENSYAEGDLTVTDQHLGLPASTTHCARLRASLPDTGRAVLTCDLRQEGSVRWRRTPAGEWRCTASTAAVHAAPTPCPTELRRTF